MAIGNLEGAGRFAYSHIFVWGSGPSSSAAAEKYLWIKWRRKGEFNISSGLAIAIPRWPLPVCQ